MSEKFLPPAAGKKRHGPRPKHVPVRTCVVCREQSSKRQLVRIVRPPAGEAVIDPSGRANGRGAYLCDRPACWQRAAETDVLARALNTHLSDELRLMLRNHAQEMPEPNAEHSGEKVRIDNVE